MEEQDLAEAIAERFRAISEPARLRILTLLRDGEKSVNEIAETTGLLQSNASKHLKVLHRYAFLYRRREGLLVYYGLADEEVFHLFEVMYRRFERQHAAHHALVDSAAFRIARRSSSAME